MIGQAHLTLKRKRKIKISRCLDARLRRFRGPVMLPPPPPTPVALKEVIGFTPGWVMYHLLSGIGAGT